jgi:hypothetical protein
VSGFADFDEVPAPDAGSPWGPAGYTADLDRLTGLLSKCVGAGGWRGRDSGDLGFALDLWVADELRRAGYEPDAVWPRAVDPRVLPASVARSISRLSVGRRDDPIVRRIEESAGSAGAVVQGEFFAKSVDVLVADWDRGVELMVSTKAMVSSFGKNLTNRWEEFVGDLRNIRGRFPMAALGVVFLADNSIVEGEPYSFQRLLDMLRKLRLETGQGGSYDATLLLLTKATGPTSAVLDIANVPQDLGPSQFYEALLTRVFERLPVSERVAARGLYGRTNLPTLEVAPTAGPQGPAPE